MVKEQERKAHVPKVTKLFGQREVKQ